MSDDAPLPPGWDKVYSKSQKRNYYFHAETKHTQWHFPTASEAADPIKAKKRAEMNKQQEDNKKRSSSEVGGGGCAAVAVAAAAAKRPRTNGASVDYFLRSVDATSVAIIVPFRDLHAAQKRSMHLKAFVPHMVKFLTKQQKKGLITDFHIYIMEQSDDGRKFNRGKLLNIGFDMAKKSKRGHDVFIFHDVDLLPGDNLAKWYCKYPTTPIHIARVWDRYSTNPKYFGGVVSFSSPDFQRINGFPNNFWGWGGEDDEMQRRLVQVGIDFAYPDSGTLVDLEGMSKDEKLGFLKENRVWMNAVKWENEDEHEHTWNKNGLADLEYEHLGTVFLDEAQHCSKVTVDVKWNGRHWTNEKAGINFQLEDKTFGGNSWPANKESTRTNRRPMRF